MTEHHHIYLQVVLGIMLPPLAVAAIPCGEKKLPLIVNLCLTLIYPPLAILHALYLIIQHHRSGSIVTVSPEAEEPLSSTDQTPQPIPEAEKPMSIPIESSDRSQMSQQQPVPISIPPSANEEIDQALPLLLPAVIPSQAAAADVEVENHSSASRLTIPHPSAAPNISE
ncbi:MAG: YqaE/Pmp3 family membrane protein [Chloroflexota bacterium]